MDRKRSHKQSFKKEYEATWPVLKRSKISDDYIYCTVCDTDFTITHGGKTDCRRHVDGPRHKNNAKMKTTNHQLTSMFAKSTDSLMAVTRAEALFAKFLLEHNCPLSIADHASRLFPVMFPDSEIAKKYSSARTKTTSIVKSFSRTTQEELVETLKCSKFVLSTDGSNTASSQKLYPIVVTYSDKNLKKNVTCVLSLPYLEIDSTGENIFRLLDEELKKFGLSWKNCVCFCADNASVMLGKHKGVSSFIQKENNKVFIHGCACHLVHLTAQHAARELKCFDIEDFLVNVYYYLKKSCKRMQLLKVCQEICEVENHKIIKYGSTRWLSMGNVINRFIEQWDALRKFFEEEDGKSETYFKLKNQFQKPSTKLYLLFLSSIIPVFNEINLLFQSEAPMVHIFVSKILNFYKELLARFIKPSAFSSVENIYDVDLSDKRNQKSDEDLVVGSRTRQLLNSSDVTEDERKQFYKNVRNYFKKACSYILKKFPLQEQLFQHAEITDIRKKASSKLASLQFFLDLYDCSFEARDAIEAEFVIYQIDSFSDEIMNSERIDDAWFKIGDILDVNGSKKYKILPDFMLSILILPHSNASCERVFSIVKNNLADNRSNLVLETLEALIIEKCKPKRTVCYETTFTSKELAEAKKATALSLSGVPHIT